MYRNAHFSIISFFLLSVFYLFFKFYFIFKLYNIVLVLPNIEMNLPQVYMCSPSWSLLPPPSPYHPSGSSQCTSPKHPVSCIEPGLVTRFIYDIIRISMPFSQIIPPSPSPQMSTLQPRPNINHFLSFSTMYQHQIYIGTNVTPAFLFYIKCLLYQMFSLLYLMSFMYSTN